MMKALAMKFQRTEYGKQIRKDYESGKIHPSRRTFTKAVLRSDGICNTLTTVSKDNYIVVEMTDE